MKIMKNKFLFGMLVTLMLLHNKSISQEYEFTKQDTLRGSVTPERAWWDLTYYHLDIAVDLDNKFIKGSNTIEYKVLEPNKKLK